MEIRVDDLQVLRKKNIHIFSLLIREVIDRTLTGSSHTKQTVSTHSSTNFNSKLTRVWTSAQIKYDLMSLCTLEVD